MLAPLAGGGHITGLKIVVAPFQSNRYLIGVSKVCSLQVADEIQPYPPAQQLPNILRSEQCLRIDSGKPSFDT
jgi:hypothetical protein